jgi:hypothetical protein
MSILLPAAFVSTDIIFSSCKADVENNQFTADNIQLLDEIGETIIPATSSSPGAKAAQIGNFMKVYVTDCYTPEQQAIFWQGINKVKKLSKNKYGSEFVKLTVAQKQNILSSLENESKNIKDTNRNKAGKGDAVQTGKENESNTDNSTAKFFPMIQNLVVFGYFTSKPGATKALRYIQTPGSYKGDVPYKKGDKAWAT